MVDLALEQVIWNVEGASPKRDKTPKIKKNSDSNTKKTKNEELITKRTRNEDFKILPDLLTS
jgi:hypothetical protein